MLYSTSLRYFVEVARAGSLAEAASVLNVAVSAISRQIAKLENEVGTPLFERLPRGMILTDAGENLARYARRALIEAEAALGELRSVDLDGGLTRVGCTEGFSRNLVPNAFANRFAANPRARFALRVGRHSQVSRWVENGEVDLGVSFTTESAGNVKVELSVPMPVFALVPKDHPLATRDQVRLSDLVAWPIALLEQGTTVRQLVELACAASNIRLEPVFTTNNSTALHTFAARTGAITFGGQFAIFGLPHQSSLVARPIADKEFQNRQLQISSMMGRGLPRHVRACLSELIDLVPQLSGTQRPSGSPTVVADHGPIATKVTRSSRRESVR